MMTNVLVGLSLAIGQVGPAPTSTAPAALTAPAAGRQRVFGSPMPMPSGPAAAGSAVIVQTAPAEAVPAPAAPAANGNGKAEEKKNGDAKEEEKKPEEHYGFAKTILREYPAFREWFPDFLGKPDVPDPNAPEAPPPARRGLPAPIGSPPSRRRSFRAPRFPASP